MILRSRKRKIDNDFDRRKDGAKIFGSSFFDAIMDIDQYEDNQKHLESRYGVEIPQDLLKSLNAEKRFKPGFFGSLDGGIVLPRLSLYPYMSIFRIQVRNAVSLCGKKVVVYPSAAVFRYAWRNNLGTILEFSCEPGLLLKKTILMRPYSVVVFYNLELAHLSAFTSVVSILDDGLLFDKDGTLLDFRKSVIIFISDLGSKDLIAKLVGGPSVSDNPDGTIDEGSVGMKFEILNRVDEILMFNPFASDQLLLGARLPMKEGQHLLMTSPEIVNSLVFLFNGKKDMHGESKKEVNDNILSLTGYSRSKFDEIDMHSLCVLPLRKRSHQLLK
ncbi:hypothetical protein K7X08_013087 [Anisodus acutangulus]|uniref:ATPase AAA-type core domain-containing protein n=1 Tax=Anisodus acutangulus TaxID=402998 RepID=A0A9Q1RH56_9SOLA|nr:hypothetical protein K7X08_013087 [Anisodus acutangulus]